MAEFSSRGTAVLCEKPFAISELEHRRLVDLYPAHKLACGYMRRFYGSTQVLKNLCDNGWLGPLKRLAIREGNRTQGSTIAASFLDDPQFGWTRGVLADLGSHTIDLALYLVGAQSFAIRDREILRDGDIDRKVRAAIELRPESSHRPNVTMDYCVSWLDRQPNRIELVFERCSVWAHCSPGARVFVGNPALPDEAVALSLPESVIAAATYNQAFYLEWLAFLKGLYNETESAISARSSILTTALVEQLARVAS